MRRLGKLPLIAWIVLILCNWTTSAQNQAPSTIKLVEQWANGQTIHSGVISLESLQPGPDKDNPDLTADVKLIDLNGDGTKELTIRWGCAMVGNCEFQIYAKLNWKSSLILSTDIVQTMERLRTKNLNYFDLKLGTHNTAFDTYYRIFRFNGLRYEQTRCWTESYAVLDKNGNLRRLKKPIIKLGCT